MSMTQDRAQKHSIAVVVDADNSCLTESTEGTQRLVIVVVVVVEVVAVVVGHVEVPEQSGVESKTHLADLLEPLWVLRLPYSQGHLSDNITKEQGLSMGVA